MSGICLKTDLICWYCDFFRKSPLHNYHPVGNATVSGKCPRSRFGNLSELVQCIIRILLPRKVTFQWKEWGKTNKEGCTQHLWKWNQTPSGNACTAFWYVFFGNSAQTRSRFVKFRAKSVKVEFLHILILKGMELKANRVEIWERRFERSSCRGYVV